MATWRLAYGLQELFTQVNAAYPNRSKVSDGTIGDAAHAATVSDHNPDALGIVRAIDITHDPAHGFDSYAFADRLLAAGDSRLKYIISNSRIGGGPNHYAPVTSWCPEGVKAGVWTPYTGPSKHTDHVHISAVQNYIADYLNPWQGITPANSPEVPEVITDADIDKIATVARDKLLGTLLGRSDVTVATALWRSQSQNFIQLFREAVAEPTFSDTIAKAVAGSGIGDKDVTAEAIAELVAEKLAQRLAQ